MGSVLLVSTVTFMLMQKTMHQGLTNDNCMKVYVLPTYIDDLTQDTCDSTVVQTMCDDGGTCYVHLCDYKVNLYANGILLLTLYGDDNSMSSDLTRDGFELPGIAVCQSETDEEVQTKLYFYVDLYDNDGSFSPDDYITSFTIQLSHQDVFGKSGNSLNNATATNPLRISRINTFQGQYKLSMTFTVFAAPTNRTRRRYRLTNRAGEALPVIGIFV